MKGNVILPRLIERPALNERIVMGLESDNVCVAIIDGEEHGYDLCSENRDAYGSDSFTYIGRGVIQSVNGIPQNSKRVIHFWRYSTKK